jgi:hypothetical protein
LKHIYTVLLGNPDIEISIDLPDENQPDHEKDSNASSNEEEGESNGLLSPRNVVVPINTVEKTDIITLEDEDEPFSAKEDTDGNKEKKVKPIVPGICRGKMCKPCR